MDKNGDTSDLVINNPLTGDGILHYLVLLIISITGLYFVKKNTRFKINKKKLKVGSLILLFALIIMPFCVFAIEKYTLNLKFKGITLESEYLDYEISFNTLGGNNIDSREVTYGQAIGDLPDGEKNGYTFNGWKDQNGSDVTSRTIVKGELELTADFTAIEYDITYDLNRGTATTKNKYTIEDEFDLATPTRKGYTFAGWSGTGIDGTQTRVTISHDTGDKSFTAHWSKNQNTKYYVNHRYPNLDGTYETFREELTGPTDEEVTAPFREKYGFDNPTSSQTVVISADEDSEVTYTYKRHEFNLTLNDDIETTFTNSKYPYETEITLTAKDKANHEFTGWSNGETTKTITFTLTEDTNIYPLYDALGFNVIYNANGGNYYSNNITSNTVTYTLKDETIKKYSHTSNINDEGIQDGNYRNNQSINDVVTIPGATSLHVKLTYGIQNNNDYLYVFDYKNTTTLTLSTTGYTNRYTGESDSPKTVEFDINGDTVTFGFYSNASGAYYGYYAEVSGYVKYELIGGSYKIPTKTDNKFSGWYTNNNCTTGNEFDLNTIDLNSGIEVFAKWESAIAIFKNGYTVQSKIDVNSTSFTRSNSLPEKYKNPNYIISTNDSDIPIYMWYEEDTNTTKWYSDVTKAYLNPDSSMLFYASAPLTTINLSGLDTSRVNNMSAMFFGNARLQSLDVSGFDTSNVTNMSSMFKGCELLDTLNVSNFNTSNVTNMSSMFEETSSLKKLDISNFDTSNVLDLHSMFMFSMINTSYYVVDESSLEQIVLPTDFGKNATNMSYLFDNLINLKILNSENINTSKANNLSYMFYGCSSLNNINLSGFSNNNVENMTSLFGGCSSLSSLDLSNFNTSKVKVFNNMFLGCSNITSLDLSNFDTSNATSLYGMFYGCTNLHSVNLSSFNTSKVTSLTSMFNSCVSLEELDLSSFDTSKVTSTGMSEGNRGMFQDCTNLRKIIVSDLFVIENISNSTEMFKGCTSLVGGKGTVYDENHIDKEYAHIDGGASNPGYFTSNITSYTVTFNGNGGTASTDSLVVDSGESIATLPTAERFNYNFDGWYTDDTNGEKVNNGYTPDDDITLYAHWTMVSFPTVFMQTGACTFNGKDMNITGDECSNYTGVEYIDTGISLYSHDNIGKDYEIGFTIDSYIVDGQERQATFMNTKDEQNNYPGVVFRRKDAENGLDISSRKKANENARFLFGVDDVHKVRIFRIYNEVDDVYEIFYQFDDAPTKTKLNDLSEFNPEFDLTVWFGAAPKYYVDNNDGGKIKIKPQRILKGTLSNMYIKLGKYQEE